MADGRTLIRAARANDIATVVELITKGIPPDPTDQRGSALQAAAMFGHTDVIDVLLRAGADVNRADRLLVTPLMVAALHQQEAAVSLLLKAGADPLRRDFEQRTALWHSRTRMVSFSLCRTRWHTTLFFRRIFDTRVSRRRVVAFGRTGGSTV